MAAAWLALSTVSFLAEPARSVIVARAPTHADAPQPALGAGAFAGVARVANGCSAVLLAGGRHVLGAAHCPSAVGDAVEWRLTPSGPDALGSTPPISARIAAVAIAPGWTGTPGRSDLAVFTLDRLVSEVPAYRLASLPMVRTAPWVWVAGWGAGGSPGASAPAGTLRWGRNEYDAWVPAGGSGPPELALFDFDDGSFGRNTLGLQPGGVSSLGLGDDEAMLAGMDSGGPSFIERPLSEASAAGGSIERLRQWFQRPREGAERTASELLVAGVHAGVQSRQGSGFGGIGLDTLVSAHARWIASVAGPQVLDPSAP